MDTDDVRIRQAPELAKQAGLDVHIFHRRYWREPIRTRAKVTLTDARGTARYLSLVPASEEEISW